MKCPNCGKNIPDNSQVCPGCKTIINAKAGKTAVFSNRQLGRLLYAGLFVCAILVIIFIYLKWQVVGSGDQYSLKELASMYADEESGTANWFVYSTYIVLCMQILAVIMWIVTFTKPSPVIPLLAGGITFIGAFLFIILALFSIGTPFTKISDFTKTATAFPYLTLLISAGEVGCAWFSPKLLAAAAEGKTERAGSQGKNIRSGRVESSKKLLDELDDTVKRDGK